MFINYLKIAFRNVWNNKLFSLINIIGLAIGLSASFVIGLLIFYDVTFDKFHPEGDRIYRITSDWQTPEGESHNRGVPVPLGNRIKEIPGIESSALFFAINFQKIENVTDDKVFKNVDDVLFGDASYFEIIQYQWLAGEPFRILANPGEVVLTRSRAARYFPGATPQRIIGQTLTYNDSVAVKVVGVVEDFKERSDFNFQEFHSIKTAAYTHMKERVVDETWNNTNSGTQVFVKISKQSDLRAIQTQLDDLAMEHTDEQLKSFGQTRKFHMQPLSDLHFNPDYGLFNHSKGQPSKSVLFSLSSIAVFLLLLGCINFINLNTARATRRAREIGIRKTLGGSRTQLMKQFLIEALVLTLTAAVVSLLFSGWLLRIFSDFMPQGIGTELFKDPFVIGATVILILLVALFSGFYPALLLSGFKPVTVLKNQVFPIGGKSGLRKYLTVFQFVIAQVFIIATLLVGKQLNFMLNADMGFRTEATVFLRAWHDDDFSKRQNLATALAGIPQVDMISFGGDPPASGNINSTIATFIDKDKEVHTDLQLLFGDLNYRKLYNIPLVAGRERLNDTIREYIINQKYARMLGFEDPGETVGKVIKIGDEWHPIVGVMKDFNQHSFRSGIQPMALTGDVDRAFYYQFNTLHFEVKSGTNSGNVMGNLEKAWKGIYPEADFELNFLDDTLKQFYEQEQKTAVLLKWATGLAILISCLGLLGLVIHTTERRIKEVGIRKVLGASVAQLNLLLCKEFILLVGIAFAIATPIAWWGLHTWLEAFAYKTDLSWWVFLLSGILMLLVALAIISVKTISSANANPIKSLRTE